MSIDEISEVMDMGNSAVKMRLKRAREQLRRHLSEGRVTV
ncbi:MAG TPA: sigma factor-like helix-turn-helix DNA-binding protein [Clostridia bacterium]|nr:sigma factor-like helix-turn-helix DNA-binding protein [Clostridia bacterium]